MVIHKKIYIEIPRWMVNTGHNYTPKKKYLSLFFFIFEASIINSVLSRISFLSRE